MNGLATRNTLHEHIHGDVPRVPDMDEDAHYEFTRGRASAKVKAALPVFPRRMFLPDWSALDTLPAASGTPAEEAQRVERSARWEAIEDMASKIAVYVMLALLALSIYHTFTKPQSPPAPVKSDDFHYHQRASRLAVGQSIYLTDPHENCLVGLHRDAIGQAVVSTHC